MIIMYTRTYKTMEEVKQMVNEELDDITVDKVIIYKSELRIDTVEQIDDEEPLHD